jgi:hypothetical protein
MAAPATFTVNINAISTSLFASPTYPVLVLTPAAGNPIELLGVEITTNASSSGIAEIEFIRSGTNTVYTAGTSAAAVFVANNYRDAAVATTGEVYSAAATGGGPATITSLKRTFFNAYGNGWVYVPVPEARYTIAGGGMFGIRFPVLTGVTYDLAVTFMEF